MGKRNFVIFLITALLLIFYDLYKASHASFTFDESYTYLNYVSQSFAEIISYSKTVEANNHILNTLLMKLSESLFGNSELALRLPAILAHIVYLLFTYKLFNRYAKKFFIPFFILANANPYLIDFFSLARGYGICIAIMTGAMYYCCRFLEDQKPRHHVLALVLTGIGCVANFSLINIFLILIVIYNLFHYFIYRAPLSIKSIFRANKSNLMIFFIFLAILYKPVYTLVKDKLIWVGGSTGFWSDTVGSLLECSAYFQPYEKVLVLFWEILSIAFFCLFLFRGVQYLKVGNKINLVQKITLFFGSLLVCIILSTLLQNAVLGTPFLMSRFALFIYPLFIFMTCFLILDISSNIHKYIGTGVLFLLSAVFFIHTCLSINTQWYYEWRYKSIPDAKNMFSEMEARKPANNPVSLGSSLWMFEPVLNFYRVTLHLDWLGEVTPFGISYQNDFFFVSQEDMERIPPDEVEVIHVYPQTKSYLIKNLRNACFSQAVGLMASNKKYVYADMHSAVKADSDHQFLWTSFAIIKIRNDECAIRAFDYHFLSTVPDHQNLISASGKHADRNETYTMLNLDSNLVAFKAFNGKYISVDKNSLELFAKSDSIGGQEKFILF